MDRIDGWAEDADGARLLRVRVSAPPVGGAANAALVRLLARAAGVPKSAVAIVQGEASRLKTVEIAGDPAALSSRLAALGARR
jgi:uncharacterized protein YggU (UPF0235/DUF167 family)